MGKEQWDERYSSAEYVYGTEPNAFLKEQVSQLKPALILFPGEGEGRNSVWAASMGWQSFAFDQSAEGRKKAMKLAESKGVSIDYRIDGLETAEYPEGSFDVLALIFIHTDPLKRQKIHRRLVTFLKPGGILIIEGFSKEQMAFSSGGPRDPGMLFSVDDLREDFGSMEIVQLEKLQTYHDEGDFHRGESSVVRLVARKK